MIIVIIIQTILTQIRLRLIMPMENPRFLNLFVVLRLKKKKILLKMRKTVC